MSGILLLGAGKRTSASGPALWTPNDEAGLLGWWDLSDTGSYSSGTWTKRWGTLNNITSDSVAPTLITTGFSGDKAALSINGNSNMGMAIASPGVTELSFVIVLNVTAVAAAVNPLLMNRAALGVGIQGLLLQETYGISVRYGNGTAAEDYTATWPGYGLIVTQMSNALRASRYNGAAYASNAVLATGTQPATTDAIKINRWIGSAQNWQAQIAAIGVFTTASYGTTLAEKIEGFVAHNNLGVTTAILPGGHTYKTSAPTV